MNKINAFDKFYPPCNQKGRKLIIKYVITIFGVLVMSYVYGNIFELVFPRWFSMIIFVVFLILCMWLYRIEKVWQFSWKNQKIEVSMKQNMFLLAWVKIILGTEIIATSNRWYKGPYIIYDTDFNISNNVHQAALCFKSTSSSSSVECAMKINGENLEALRGYIT